MDKLVEALMMIKDECEKHPYSCSNCLFDVDDMCIIETIPCDWDIEKIKQGIAKAGEKQ